jgi:hypothetical protein
MEGLHLPCIPPLSSDLGRYSRYLSFYRQFFTSKTLDYARRSISYIFLL